MKIVFSFFTYGILWWIQYLITLGIFAGLSQGNPLVSGSSIPGLLGLVCLYTSYVLLKKIHKIQFIKTFFSKE